MNSTASDQFNASILSNSEQMENKQSALFDKLRRNVEFGRGKLTVLNAAKNDASLSSAAKLEELRDSMIALMDTDATLLKQMEALREAIENLKTVSMVTAFSLSSGSSLEDLDECNCEIANLNCESAELQQEFPGKRYFSRQNSVLRIPIPPTRLRGKRFSPGELGLAAKISQRPLSDASFTSSSKGQQDAHEKAIACNENPVKITTYAESLTVNHDCQSSFDSGIHLTHNDDKEDFYIRVLHVKQCLVLTSSGIKMVDTPVEFGPVIFPPNDQRTLPIVLKTPIFNPSIGEYPKYATRRLIEIRGPELVNNKLIHQQYGVRAVRGGFLHHNHFETIRKKVNPWITKNSFAIWRVDPPWLPRTKVPQGMKLGGGKRSIHHYVTPVRAGRIIIEYGGYVTIDEALRILKNVATSLPFPAEMVTQEDLVEEEKTKKFIEENNRNIYTWEFLMKWNMQNCSRWLSHYDYIWGGKYR
ncbi:39S ribosomal protein L16, mitochondrial [Trichinella papuae]|uniref:Large ribosomal subunit protein uL16m n=1 Tax=Trichinella papuae TaxID=268474 RepID=A0A0V1MCM7_9BILA|nr:39S ribosomal protein L16, mitochondrial [Trichinella papuae]